ncbi:MAG: ABC transporter ATP-binding protein [Lachnospiraceae bacterium]|nr:ABC transporter ATP-binding protein [Lachnospiraceae bacterium]
MSFLEVKDLTRIYGKKENQLIALDHVSFSIEKGQFIAVTGASGSGKSTLLNLLGTMDDAQEGTVKLEDEDILSMKEKQKAIFRRRKIGFVFQEYNLVPVLNVEENIQIPVRLDGKQMNPEYLEKLLHILGLEERRYNLPEELSGGQKQRVAIGRALANHPSLILADEPTGNLDHQNGLEVMALLKESVQQFALTLIVVTHDPAIASMADRVITLSDGAVISDAMVRHALSSEISEK